MNKKLKKYEIDFSELEEEYGEKLKRQLDIENFLIEYNTICKKYNISLAHEDQEGSFIFCEYDEENIDWVRSGDDIKEYERYLRNSRND